MREMTAERDIFPFSAIIGQDEMKKGLILNIIEPKIGGILVFGEKGTAKSTAARSIAAMLPRIPAVKGCRFRCRPDETENLCPECRAKRERGERLETEYVKMKVVDLPVSATEDRVVGSLDIEKAIQEGVRKFERGVLAEANRGILYIDEINLLDDHIVDLLLDSAAMGVNIVEREGVSFSHPARFILAGTMNPEEGELRPQLLDRFGLCVEVHGIKDAEKRIEIIKTRAQFEEDPQAFIETRRVEEEELAKKITRAREAVKDVELEDALLRRIAKAAIELDIDGHRGDLTMMKASKAHAAFEGRKTVSADDMKAVARMVFLHRLKSLPFENARTLNIEKIENILDGNG
jgi:Mg-chelatase subunit ChlI